jgi:hypothetical protein
MYVCMYVCMYVYVYKEVESTHYAVPLTNGRRKKPGSSAM